MLTAFGRNYSVDVDYSQASARYFTRPVSGIGGSFTQWSTPNAANHWPRFIGGVGVATPAYRNFCSFWTKSNLQPGTVLSAVEGYFMSFSQGYGDSSNDFFGITYGGLNQIIVTYRLNGVANQIQHKYQLYSAANASITGLVARNSEWVVGGSQNSNSNDFVHLAVGLEIPTFPGIPGNGPPMSTGVLNLYWNGVLLTPTSVQTAGIAGTTSGNATFAVINGDIGQSSTVTQQTALGVFQGGASVPPNATGPNIDELLCLSKDSDTYEAYLQYYGISGTATFEFQSLATQLYGGGSPFDNSAAKDEVAGAAGATVGAYNYRFESDFNNFGSSGTVGASPAGDMTLYGTGSLVPTIVVPHA